MSVLVLSFRARMTSARGVWEACVKEGRAK